MESKEIEGKQKSVDGFAHEHIAAAILMKKIPPRLINGCSFILL